MLFGRWQQRCGLLLSLLQRLARVVSVSPVPVSETDKLTDASRPAPTLPTVSTVSSQSQLHAMLSRSRVDTRLWLQCRLALANSLLLTAGGLCGSDGLSLSTCDGCL